MSVLHAAQWELLPSAQTGVVIKSQATSAQGPGPPENAASFRLRKAEPWSARLKGCLNILIIRLFLQGNHRYPVSCEVCR
ncbi:unnamed protein product [Arctogadus glacialis]